MYNFNLKRARLIFVEYDETNDTFLVHIVYTSNHSYIIVYDFDLNPVKVA
jgi:predicted nucleic acid-binding protein